MPISSMAKFEARLSRPWSFLTWNIKVGAGQLYDAYEGNHAEMVYAAAGLREFHVSERRMLHIEPDHVIASLGEQLDVDRCRVARDDAAEYRVSIQELGSRSLIGLIETIV